VFSLRKTNILSLVSRLYIHPFVFKKRYTMIVLGIDPGSRVTGYALVTKKGGRFQLIEAGVIKTDTKKPIPERLLQIQPETAGIETVFYHHSSEAIVRLSQARGVALLACAQANLPSEDYNPSTIKKTVGGHGKATKKEMVRLVSRLLGLSKYLTSDAADATAIAITHLMHSSFKRKFR
jgi:crossover junction endodeoxyribonuclease RuvC